MELVKKKENQAKPENMGLEVILETLCRYGTPALHRFKGGWFCKVEMNTNQVGATFEVKSNYSHRTPTEAARVCFERVTSSLAALGSGVGRQPVT